METNANKATIQRFFDAVGARDLDGMVGVLADDFVIHTSIPGIEPGPDGFRAFMQVFYTAFPEQHTEVQQLIAEGYLVAALHTHHVKQDGPFAGLPPTGKEATVSGLELFRFANGRIAEMWHHDDMLSLLHQLGALPARS